MKRAHNMTHCNAIKKQLRADKLFISDDASTRGRRTYRQAHTSSLDEVAREARLRPPQQTLPQQLLVGLTPPRLQHVPTPRYKLIKSSWNILEIL